MFFDYRYLGQWNKNHPSGKGKFLWSDGVIYIGDVVDGYPDGVGVFQANNGELYSGQFKRGVPHGLGKLSFGNITILVTLVNTKLFLNA